MDRRNLRRTIDSRRRARCEDPMTACLRVAGCLIAAAAAGTACQGTDAQSSTALRPIATIALSGVRGRIDHLAFDQTRQRLFVAALGNDTVEVIDTSTNTHAKSLPGFHEPQGIAVVPDLGAV